jgi:hypothetical protein
MFKKVLLFTLFSFSSLLLAQTTPTSENVAKLYVATFNRAPDSAGLDYWVNDSGLDLEEIAQSFFDQDETQELYPASVTSREFVQSVYSNLFNREPDSAGWDYWENELDTGSFSKNSFIQAVINGALDNDTSNDATILNNKTAVGMHFAAQGLSDVEQAKNIMVGISDSITTVLDAKDTIQNSYNGDILPKNVSGKLVDPYIEGAVLCEDINSNGACDDGEQTTNATNENGEFTFSESLTPGVDVIIKSQGSHLGETYDLNISAVVAEDGTVDVVSPLTTFNSKELTNEQVAEILNAAAKNAGVSNWNITSEDIKSDPLANELSSKSIVNMTEDDLNVIQASIASYGILKVMSGSETLNSLSAGELYLSGINEDGAVNRIATFMIKGITTALNTSILEQVQEIVEIEKQNISAIADASSNETVIAQVTAQAEAAGFTGDSLQAYIDQALASVPSVADYISDPTAEQIINVGVVYMDRFSEIGYSTCNATDGDAQTKVSAALDAIEEVYPLIITNENMISLGQKFYGMKYSSSYSSYTQYLTYESVIAGINDGENGKTTYRFNSNNEITAQ